MEQERKMVALRKYQLWADGYSCIIFCPTLPVNNRSVLHRSWRHHHSQWMQERKEKVGKKDECSLVTTLRNFKLFSRDVPQNMQNITTKDFAGKTTGEDLLMARQKGQEMLDTVAGQRLLPCVEREIKLRGTLPENKPLSWAKTMSTVEHRKQSRQTGTLFRYWSSPTMQDTRWTSPCFEAWTDARPLCSGRRKRQSALRVKGNCVSCPHTWIVLSTVS